MKKILNNSYGHLAGFVDRLPDGGFEQGGEILYDIRNKVKLFEVGGEKIVVKRFKKPHRFNRFMYTFFRKSKAARAYHHSFILQNYGVSTPAAIAYIEIKDRGLIAESYLVTQYSEYKSVRDLSLEEKYIQAMGFNQLVAFTVSLHEMGIHHKDFTDTNVLYRLNEDLTFDFQVIDINRMSFGHMSKSACMSSLRKVGEDSQSILAFAEKYAELRGWNRFYCLAVISLSRGMLEQRKKTKSYIKNLIRSNA